MGEEEAAETRRVILSGWVTQGPEVKLFEEEFAQAVGSPYACAVSNCTTGLHLALRVLGVGEGDEVITVSHSFIATVNAIRYTGAIPVMVDIDSRTLNLDPNLIESAISRKTKAILVVHQIGLPADLGRIIPIAKAHGLPVIEDAACAIGSQINVGDGWEMIGKPHGDIACFSFHPRKVITTGDGGMITTRNPEYDAKFRLWRQHSMSVPDTIRHSSKEVVFEQYTELGYNYRMTDIQAAVGRVQLRRLTEIVNRRRALAFKYNQLLADIPGLQLPYEPEYARFNYQSYAVWLPEGVDQRAVMQYLMDHGVGAKRGIMNSHQEPAYQTEPWRGVPTDLPESVKTRDQVLLLPLYHQMTEEEQNTVVSALTGSLR